MKVLKVLKDRGSMPLYTRELAEAADIYDNRLAADTEKTLVVPAGALMMIIATTDNVYISKSAITLPTEGAEFVAHGAEIASEAYEVVAGETYHFKAREAIDITISFYRV